MRPRKISYGFSYFIIIIILCCDSEKSMSSIYCYFIGGCQLNFNLPSSEIFPCDAVWRLFTAQGMVDGFYGHICQFGFNVWIFKKVVNGGTRVCSPTHARQCIATRTYHDFIGQCSNNKYYN